MLPKEVQYCQSQLSPWLVQSHCHNIPAFLVWYTPRASAVTPHQKLASDARYCQVNLVHFHEVALESNGYPRFSANLTEVSAARIIYRS